jgi:hypothetical protein
MKSFKDMDFHPDAERLVQILCEKTQNSDPLFFRVLVAYFLAVVASMMRAKIKTLDRGEIPINLYAINLSVSGAGKGHSMNVMEDQVIDQFRYKFVENTMPLMAAQNLPHLAVRRAARKQTDPDAELANLEAEYEGLGPLLFSFDSATGPAIKDIRHKLLMAEAGALNLQIDEIGINLTAVAEALGPYLELYDVGKIKQKLTKNTSDNKRREEIDGRTPANLMAFGTPTRLLNGGKTEEEFYALLDTGYARRCFFGYTRNHQRKLDLTPDQILDQRINGNSDQFLEDMSDRLADLSDVSQANKVIQVDRDVTLLFITYEQDCIRRANLLGEHDELRKAELAHRYFKALKLAGAYAFIDGSPEITEDHAYAAIKLAEESGHAFDCLLTRDRPHVKLAKYLAEVRHQVTQADLVEDLPFYKGSISAKQEMLQLAIAYGYQNNIIIKKAFSDGVEFISGETLEETNLDNMIFSYSNDIAQGYIQESKPVAFDDLWKLTQAQDVHWCNHAFKEGHRCEDKAIPGFNMLVLDVDHGVSLATVKELLKDYKALYYTTKRHQTAGNGDRFRVIMPINYTLELDAKDYKEFMKSLFSWLPFEVDEATGQRARKWLSHPGHYEYQDGEVLDILPFIPKTSKNEEFRSRVLDQQGMDNLERWVMNNTGDGNRNNMLLRYAMILVDGGFDFDGVRQRVSSLNDKLADKLDEAEILGTIMVSVGKALALKQAA